ncbi:MAG: endo alpha-1,4 polygalactosaminidase [Tepidisphaerales bacterium]
MSTFIVVSSLLSPALHVGAAEPMPLADVRTFMFQFQGLDSRGAIQRLAETDYDMLIIDDLHSAKGGESVDMGDIVRKLRLRRPNRVVLAYLDIGAVESDRFYWQKPWRPATASVPGSPEFILTTNSRGWDDTFPAAFWDKRWQQIVATGESSALRRTMAAGFDGLVLDWIDSHAEPRVVAEAKRQGVDPAREMVDLVSRVRDEARRIRPGARVVAMNGIYLAAEQPKFIDLIDGILVESTWFSGKGDVSWSSGDGGDIPNNVSAPFSTEARLRQYQKYRDAGRPVFSVDYCLKPEHAADVYRRARGAGLVPLVTRTSLGGITTTPPSR